MNCGSKAKGMKKGGAVKKMAMGGMSNLTTGIKNANAAGGNPVSRLMDVKAQGKTPVASVSRAVGDIRTTLENEAPRIAAGVTASRAAGGNPISQFARGMKKGGKVTKTVAVGVAKKPKTIKARGMGAATKGGNFRT
jgi:hypothetical protein